MLKEEFYMDMSLELNPFEAPSHKHYMNGKELRKSYVSGAKVLIVNHKVEDSYTLEDAIKRSEELFEPQQQYFIKENKIYKIYRV